MVKIKIQEFISNMNLLKEITKEIYNEKVEKGFCDLNEIKTIHLKTEGSVITFKDENQYIIFWDEFNSKLRSKGIELK